MRALNRDQVHEVGPDDQNGFWDQPCEELRPLRRPPDTPPIPPQPLTKGAAGGDVTWAVFGVGLMVGVMAGFALYAWLDAIAARWTP